VAIRRIHQPCDPVRCGRLIIVQHRDPADAQIKGNFDRSVPGVGDALLRLMSVMDRKAVAGGDEVRDDPVVVWRRLIVDDDDF
jgi:hypothetical protein